MTFLHCLKRSPTKPDEELEKPDHEETAKVEGEGQVDEMDKSARCTEKEYKPKPSNLDWLNERSWNYFIHFEEEFEEVQGGFRV